MIPSSFDYHAPGDLAEALALLAQYGDDAKVLSGGQSLLPLLKLRLGEAGHLIDINRIPGLEYIREEGDHLAIGGRTRESAIERSELIAGSYPLLADAAAVVADPLVRNLATLGGNLAHGDPANDHPAAMLALRATVVATGPNGERTIPIDDFFPGFFETALAAGEILTEIRIPRPAAGSGGAYKKLERKVGDFATAASAVQITVSGGEVTAAGIALTNVNPSPRRAADAEGFLVGGAASDERFAEAARLAAAACQPSADRRGAVEYKREMARVLTHRALTAARERAGGS